MFEVIDGWVHGELPGPSGPVEVILSAREDKQPWQRLLMNPPNLCLHTTEGGTSLGERYKYWKYPPNFACGDGHIVQLFPLGFASEGVDTKDGFLLQVELAFTVDAQQGGPGASHVYLPPPSTLDPLIALMAFLHKGGFITTALQRPNPEWPIALDRPPQASDDYYRRKDGTWPKPGVYGHVEIPDDEHYDPASLDYPVIFEMVRRVIEGDDLTPEQEEVMQRLTVFLETLTHEMGDIDDDNVGVDADVATASGAAKRIARTVLKVEEEE
jgi:hypothetical protein